MCHLHMHAGVGSDPCGFVSRSPPLPTRSLSPAASTRCPATPLGPIISLAEARLGSRLWMSLCVPVACVYLCALVAMQRKQVTHTHALKTRGRLWSGQLTLAGSRSASSPISLTPRCLSSITRLVPLILQRSNLNRPNKTPGLWAGLR